MVLPTFSTLLASSQGIHFRRNLGPIEVAILFLCFEHSREDHILLCVASNHTTMKIGPPFIIVQVTKEKVVRVI